MKKSAFFAGVLVCAICFCVATVSGAAEQRSATTSTGNVFLKAHSLLREGKYPEAAPEYDAIALKYQGEGQPAKSYRVEAFYWAGLAYSRIDNWPEGKQRLEQVVAAGEVENPAVKGYPAGFQRLIVAYQRLMEIATREKDYKRARELAEAGDKKITERLASIERMMETQSAPKSELLLRPLLLKTKPLFDWKVAHPEQIESHYYNALRKANAATAKAVPTSWTALMRNPDLATTGTCATSSCGCGCGTTTTTTATSCCKP
jgi:tetratricopeptide (TPR) repeat protein